MIYTIKLKEHPGLGVKMRLLLVRWGLRSEGFDPEAWELHAHDESREKFEAKAMDPIESGRCGHREISLEEARRWYGDRGIARAVAGLRLRAMGVAMGSAGWKAGMVGPGVGGDR